MAECLGCMEILIALTAPSVAAALADGVYANEIGIANVPFVAAALADCGGLRVQQAQMGGRCPSCATCACHRSRWPRAHIHCYCGYHA